MNGSDDDHLDSKPSTRDNSAPKKARRIGVLDIAIVVVGLVITLAIMVHIQSSERLFYQPYTFRFHIPPYENVTGLLNLYSPTFSAQSKIEAYMTIDFSTANREAAYAGKRDVLPPPMNIRFPETMYVTFPDSNCASTPKEANRYDRPANCQMELPLQHDEDRGYFYQDHATLWYPIEGNYGVYATWAPFENQYFGLLPEEDQNLIRIGALPSTESYENTKTVNMITSLVAYVAIISAYFQGRSTLGSYFSKRQHG